MDGLIPVSSMDVFVLVARLVFSAQSKAMTTWRTGHQGHDVISGCEDSLSNHKYACSRMSSKYLLIRSLQRLARSTGRPNFGALSQDVIQSGESSGISHQSKMNLQLSVCGFLWHLGCLGRA